MGLHMQTRGRKSWGWTNGEEIVKSLGELETGWNYSLAGFPKAALHTRHPTTGSLCEENSHPFKIGNIIGMHNGMVHNHDELQKKYERNCQVDSEQIFHHINDELPLEEIRAYGAIIYWKDGLIHLGRFNNGDLTLARTDIAWIFASTDAAVRQSLRFSGLGAGAVICKLREDTLYRLNGNELEIVGPLTFGSYSKSYGSWEGGTGQYNGEFDEEGYQYRRYGSSYSSYNRSTSSPSVDAPKTTPIIEAKTEEKKSLTIEEKIGQMIIGVIVKSRAIENLKNGSSVPDQDVAIEVTSANTERDWSCGLCHDAIAEGDQFAFTDEYDIICEKCSIVFPTRIKSFQLLATLPQDIIKMSDMLNTNDLTGNEELECESCDSAIMIDDIVVLTKDNSIICTDCFANGEGEGDEVIEEVKYLSDSSRHETETQIIELFDDMRLQVTDKITGEITLYGSGDTEAKRKYLM